MSVFTWIWREKFVEESKGEEILELNTYNRWLILLVVFILMAVSQWLLAAAKLIAAHYCAHHLWNVTGCVVLGTRVS